MPFVAALAKLLQNRVVPVGLILGDERYSTDLHQIQVALHDRRDEQLEHRHPLVEGHEADLRSYPHQ